MTSQEIDTLSQEIESGDLYYRPFSYLEIAIANLLKEIARLKRGDFTPEEFHNLCHNLHEKGVLTRADFEKGCTEYQNKLFGCKHIE